MIRATAKRAPGERWTSASCSLARRCCGREDRGCPLIHGLPRVAPRSTCGIDNTEIIRAVYERRAPMISASARLQSQR
jgi:hypothetical protein